MPPPRGLRALRSSPHKLLLDLICDWLIICQVCVIAECVFNQQHLIICILQYCSQVGERRQRLASSLQASGVPQPTLNEEA